MEHHSNLVPWQMLASARRELAYVGVDDDGTLDLDELDALLAREPKLVAVTHVSNVVGTINPVAEIIAPRARRRRGRDGRRLAGRPALPVDVGALDADFYAWTAHKAYGPTGIGVLHGKRELLEAMPPFLGGGHMIARVGDIESTYAEPPAKFEAGTIADRRGDRPRRRRRLPLGHRDGRRARARAASHRRTRSSASPRCPASRSTGRPTRTRAARSSTFALDGVHPHDVAEILGREGVCVRAGHHCAQPLMRRLGVAASTRASFAIHTTREDVDRLVDALGTVQEIFG